MRLYNHCICLFSNIKTEHFTNCTSIFPCIIDKTLLVAHYHVPTHCGHIQCSPHLQGGMSRHGYLGISCHGTPRLHRNRRWPPNGHKQNCINCNKSQIFQKQNTLVLSHKTYTMHLKYVFLM